MNTKIIVIIVLILVIFLLYRKIFEKFNLLVNQKQINQEQINQNNKYRYVHIKYDKIENDNQYILKFSTSLVENLKIIGIDNKNIFRVTKR